MDNVVQFKPAEGSVLLNKAPKTMEREVKTFHVDAICPKCDTIMVCQPLEQTMALWRMQPAGEYYPHTCGNESCKHVENYPTRYPTLVYRFVD